jgi:DNA-binding NarL/FixJ family response regulator
MAQPICILITDDHPVVRAGLGVLADGKSSRERKARADDVTETAWRARSLRPGAILMDLVIWQQDGVQGMDVIQMGEPEARILVPSRLCQDERASAAIKVAVRALSRDSNHVRAVEMDPGGRHDRGAEAPALLARELAEVGSGSRKEVAAY